LSAEFRLPDARDFAHLRHFGRPNTTEWRLFAVEIAGMTLARTLLL